MLNRIKINTFILLFIFTATALYSAEETKLGKVHKLNKATGEVVVAIPGAAGKIKMGNKLYVRIDGKPVILRATFPMMTVVNCRLLPGYNKYYKQISRNMPVYRYSSKVTEETKKIYDEIKRESGSAFELSMLCEKNIKNEKVREYLKSLGNDYKESKFKDVYYYSYKKKGISISFKNDGTLTAIFLYAEGSDGFKQYPKVLPENLKFSNTRTEVEKRLGKPPKSGGNGVIPFWVVYSDFGIGLTYKSKSETDMSNGIHHISITKPKKPVKAD